MHIEQFTITKELVKAILEIQREEDLTMEQIEPLWQDMIDAWNDRLEIPDFQFMINNFNPEDYQ